MECCLKQKWNLKPLLHEMCTLHMKYALFKHLLSTHHVPCIPSAPRQNSSGKVDVNDVVVVATFLAVEGSTSVLNWSFSHLPCDSLFDK